MMINKSFVFLLFIVQAFFLGPAYGSILMCKNKKIVRTLRVIKVEKENKCVTVYSKGGIDKIVGSGKNIVACSGVYENIRENLERADWKCKEVVPADIIQHYELN